MLAAALVQGLPILCGLSGAGECYIGNMPWCVGQVILSCLWWCGISIFISGFIKTPEQPDDRLAGCAAVAYCAFCLGSLAHVLWWAISLAMIVQGKQNDGNGCPLE